MYRKYKIDDNYFNCIDTHEKAYIFGFICADGYNREDCLDLCQNESRIDILEKINNALSSTYPLVSYVEGKYSLRIYSTKLCKALTALGAHRNKSFTLRFPNIEKQFIPSFVLGYFDGDGCV